MDYKAIGLKFLKGAISGAIAAFGTLQITGHMDEQAWKGILFAVASAAFHAGWEAVRQSKET